MLIFDLFAGGGTLFLEVDLGVHFLCEFVERVLLHLEFGCVQAHLLKDGRICSWFLVGLPCFQLFLLESIRFFSLAKESVEDHKVIVLRNESRKGVVLLQKAHEFVGWSIVCQFLWYSSLLGQKLFKNFLTKPKITFPMPVLWQL